MIGLRHAYPPRRFRRCKGCPESLIASFQPILTLEPSGAGVEQYLASVSEEAEPQYLESPRYAYLVAELEGQVAGFVARRDHKHLFRLFVADVRQPAAPSVARS